MSGNAFFGDLLLNDPVLFYTLRRNRDMEGIFFIRKLFHPKFYRHDMPSIQKRSRKNINLYQGIINFANCM